MQNGDNYLRDSHLKGPIYLPTHALFDLYFAYSTSALFNLTTMAAVGESFWGDQHCNAIPMPASCPVCSEATSECYPILNFFYS